MKKKLKNLTLGEWQQLCEKHYVCKDEPHTYGCKTCPMDRVDTDCPIWDTAMMVNMEMEIEIE